MNLLTGIVLTVGTFFFMEFVAWFTHKYVMHGLLWTLHRDHHQGKEGFFERNDFFFLIFAIPGFLLILLGVENLDVKFFIGLGISIYGLCYFLVHDIFIHQRLKFFRNSNNRYFRALRRAHKMHHKHFDKHDGECFGMLLVPPKYFREESR